MDEFAIILVDHYQIDEPVDTLVNEMNAAMMRLIPELVRPQPGAPELIDYIQAQGWPLAIASSSPMSIIDATVEAQGWGDIFKVRCSAEFEAKGKPAPDVYLTASKTLGIDPSMCLALEDSPNGSRAAVAAGMTCYAVPDTSHSPKIAFANITPHVFDSLHDVAARLATM
jgi:HAD superfamily hydrolase (TIGR01509 family)